jgi:hypothetical protein
MLNKGRFACLCSLNVISFHSQRDEPLFEFFDVPVYPPIPNPYDSLTPAELAAFGIGLARVDNGDDDDDDEANGDEEMEDDK